MTEQHPSPTPSAGQNATGPQPTSAWVRLQRWAHRGILLVWVAAAFGQVYLRLFFEHPLENPIRNMSTLSMGMLLGGLTILWWLLFAPVSQRTRWLVLCPVLLGIGAFVGSIKHVDMSGNMWPDITFRWQESVDERLERFQTTTAPNSSTEAPADVIEITPEDMPAYRGVNRDGIVLGPPISHDWTAHPPRELWRRPCGGGYASFAIVGERAITIEQRRDDEVVVCYALKTGDELWVHRYPAHFIEFAGGPGPRSTPTVDGDAVYAVGAMGDVRCLDLQTGQVRWHDNMLKSFNLPNATWAMTSSPLIVEDLVVVNPGGANGNGLLAYDKTSGKVVWSGPGVTARKAAAEQPAEPAATASDSHGSQPGNAATGYSSPTLVTLAGIRQILNFDGVGLHGHDPASGQELWFYPFKNDPLINVAQPIVLGEDRVFVTAGYGSGARLVQVQQTGADWTVKELWANQNMKSRFASSVLIDGFIYGLDEGIMACIDPVTGDRKWKGGKTPLRGRYSHGQMLAVDGAIVLSAETGELVLIDPSPEQLIELGHIDAIGNAKVWNPLAIAHGYCLMRNAEEIVCYDLRMESSSPSAAAEVTRADATQP